VTNATDVIAHLLPRKAAPIVERHTGLPFGWGLWLRALPEKLGRITREKADAVVAVLGARAPRPPEPVPAASGRLRAFRSLFYQGWGPPPREERWMRWFAGFSSSVVHLLFFLFLLWVALVQIPPPPPQAGDDSSRVRLEIVGDGSPGEAGGAAQAGESAAEQAAQADPAPRTAPAPARSAPAEATPPPAEAALPELAVEMPQVRPRDVPQPALANQPVQVTEVPEPTRAYVLPPPTPRLPDVALPALREIGVPTRDVPAPVAAPVVRRDLPVRAVDAPAVATRDVEVREREVLAPAPQVREVPVPTREVTPRAVATPERSVRQADIREPAPRPAPAAPSPAPATAVAQAPATASAPTPAKAATPGASAPSSAPRGTSSAAASTRPGPAATARPGGWDTPARADDWGNSRRDVAGDSGADGRDAPGLYNADGSLRVPGGAGDATAQRGAPGGENDQWTREQLEQAGTWLQRPPYDYEPTSFDKYWVPNESLLAEWVRRNVREMEISIPGTNMKLKCTISVLQLGGGCGLGSLFPEPPKARPPPEIPVKRKPIPTDS